MKTGKFTLAIAITAIFTACSKEDSLTNDGSAPISALASAPSFTVSNWEGGYSWNQSDSSDYKIYTHSKSFSELTSDVINNGAVLVYVKNAPYEGAVMDKPMLTPFHILPPVGRPGYDQMWYRVVSEGNVAVKYRTNKQKYGGAADLPDGNVQFRYFILSSSALSKVGHTPASIMRLTYSEITSLFGAGE